MALIQEAEVQLAQRLASNEKPIRTKAMKKLRKYINVRSQKATGGFTGDELLKLWKGLFYCLWMQDKPLLQEELSKQISSLIHSFQDVDGQFLYLESFLQTFKREWTGIDRLRMDKFFQLIRFMFRQMFEMLKRKDWESSVVSRFLELLTAQLLQSSSGAPSGMQFHILDLYMTELAAVGSAELTAEQNLIFIQPFCKAAAKTKDRTLFGAICNNILSTVIEQAPYAIEDLMKEVKAAGASDSDSGQASEEDDEDDQLKEKTTSKPVGKKGTAKQINGHKPHEEEGEEEEEDDELLHLEDSDTEAPCDDDMGPVLQFDYGALADKLFELASRSSTPSHNRKRLYKIIKVLRDLSEGIFPQDEYPEEVSTDEDDDMFGSRKRMKRSHLKMEGEEGAPASKKSKGKKKEALNKQNSGKEQTEQADLTANTENKKKRKKRKKKKTKQVGEEDADKSEQAVAQSAAKESEGSLESSQAEGSEKEAPVQSSISSVRVTEAATEGPSETLLLSEVKKQPTVTVSEETCQPAPCTDDGEPSEEACEPKAELPEAAGEQQPPDGAEPPTASEASAAASGKKKGKKKKGLKAPLQTEGVVSESQDAAEVEITPASSELVDDTIPTTDAAAKKEEELTAEKDLEEAAVESPSNGLSTEADPASVRCEDSAEGDSTPDAAVVPLKKAKKKGKQGETTPVASADGSTITPLRKRRKRNQKETEVEEDGAAEAPQVADAEKLLFEITMTAPAKKKNSQKLAAAQTEESSSSGTPAKKKKKKIPVVFEFEADEQEAASTSADPGSDVCQPSTPLSAKKSKKKGKTSAASDFVSFQSNAAVPTPLFCKTKGGLSTPLSSKKKCQTPTSESKKVTFGLKNNRTAEFRKTDRSLLLSPDGSSRVPFDPKQKPKFGVLKSPATPLSSRVKKTPNSKSSVKTPKSVSKRRPSAADFF